MEATTQDLKQMLEQIIDDKKFDNGCCESCKS